MGDMGICIMLLFKKVDIENKYDPDRHVQIYPNNIISKYKFNSKNRKRNKTSSERLRHLGKKKINHAA